MKALIFFILYITFTTVWANYSKIMDNSFDFNSFCESIQIEPCGCNYEHLNVYDRGEEKYNYLKNKEDILKSEYTIKLTSSDYTIEDFDFKTSTFTISSLNLKNGDILFETQKISLPIPKDIAKLIAAKKEFSFLDLYIVVKFKSVSEVSNLYCRNDNGKIHLYPEIIEYYFVCNKSNNVIYYQKSSKKDIREPFLDTPLIEGLDLMEKKEVEIFLKEINQELSTCANRKEYGTKMYTILIDKYGEIEFHKTKLSFSDDELNRCVDNIIINRKYPSLKKPYQLYFSVIIPNL
ncbi:hypothetical protein JXR93_05965 [bacterium]|nr:hypothetical protein [bacterium]